MNAIGTNVKEKFIVVLGVMCATVALPGCTTTETTTTHASSTAAASTGSVVVSVSTETTTVTRTSTPPPPPAVDVISGEKKPCGMVAADAPKFVENEAAKQ